MNHPLGLGWFLQLDGRLFNRQRWLEVFPANFPCVTLIFALKSYLFMNNHEFGLCRLSHLKHIAVLFLKSVFCSVFSFFIADSRHSEMSIGFRKDKFPSSINNVSCVWSWFVPHTKWSRNMKSKELPYWQYWLSLRSCAYTVSCFHVTHIKLKSISNYISFWIFLTYH